jgi:hypothetical protein
LLLHDQLFESGIQRRIEHFTPVFWTENHVVLAAINAGVV